MARQVSTQCNNELAITKAMVEYRTLPAVKAIVDTGIFCYERINHHGEAIGTMTGGIILLKLEVTASMIGALKVCSPDASTQSSTLATVLAGRTLGGFSIADLDPKKGMPLYLGTWC